MSTSTTGVRRVLWCSATGPDGPWLCLHCAATAHRHRPGDITQAFTTEPVAPGARWHFTEPSTGEDQ